MASEGLFTLDMERKYHFANEKTLENNPQEHVHLAQMGYQFTNLAHNANLSLMTNNCRASAGPQQTHSAPVISTHYAAPTFYDTDDSLDSPSKLRESPLLPPIKTTLGYRGPQVHRGGFVMPPKPNITRVRDFPPPGNDAYFDAEVAGLLKEIRANNNAGLPPMGLGALSAIETHSEDGGESIPASCGYQSNYMANESNICRQRKSSAQNRIIGMEMAKRWAECCISPRNQNLNPIVGASGEFYGVDEQKSDFIRAVQNEMLEYCKVCGHRHIPPGPPGTLPDRDTCGAYIPEWFPKEEVAKPWASYLALINRIVELQQILEGIPHNHPARPKFNYQYHDPSMHWKGMRRRGGWWKCRSDQNAPLYERLCNLCHKLDTEKVGPKNEEEFLSVVGQELKRLEEFVNQKVAAVGVVNKAKALARIRAEGSPLAWED
ncbi:hypothetical protein BP6252_04266 [Coleophoma cylindrospora]|uniref:Uncharacterized protein n=1 Tax=Coleophoma cylindrospora TaxID=1849047 RepID=A0A3D8S028_9HELO|nr:hypothetical protein BP6252_04266 [Coleophoma cylindrospora]